MPSAALDHQVECETFYSILFNSFLAMASNERDFAKEISSAMAIDDYSTANKVRELIDD